MHFLRTYILFTGPQWTEIGEINMTPATHRTSRLAGLAFAVLMTVVVNGGMLASFDRVATEATSAHSAQTRNVAVLDTVTVVGHRI